MKKRGDCQRGTPPCSNAYKEQLRGKLSNFKLGRVQEFLAVSDKKADFSTIRVYFGI
jgi:hypothetical protein